MADDELAGRTAAGDGPDLNEARIGRAVAAYVDSIPVPVGFVETGWRSRRGLAVRWAGASSRRNGRRGLASALVAVAALAAIAVIAAVIGVAGRAPWPQAASTSGSANAPVAGSAASAVPAPSSPPSLVPSGTPAGPALVSSPWFTMSAFGGCPASSPSEPLSGCSGVTGSRPGSLELFVGTLDGRVTLHVQRSLPVSAGLWVGRGSLPDAAGPFGGKVLYSHFDGSRSELHVVDAGSGSDDTAVTTGNVVYNAVLDPSSGTIYFGQLDPTRRRDLGVWRVGLDGPSEPKQFLPPAAGHAYTGSQEWSRTLFLTPDGSRLVVRDCQDGSCALGIHSTADADLVVSADGLRDDAVFGLTDSFLIGILSCDQGRCGIGTLDLAFGQVRSLTDDPCALSGYGVLAARADGTPLLLVPSAARATCGPAGSVLAIDLAGSSATTVWTPDRVDPSTGAVLSLAVQAQGFQGYATPDGWFLAAPNQELARTNQSGSQVPELVSLSGGAVIPLSVQPTYTP